MKRDRVEQRDDRDEEDGEPSPPGERASGVVPGPARSSGVYARSERPPPGCDGAVTAGSPAEGSCLTVEDVLRRHAADVWAWIRRSGIDESEAMDVFQRVSLEMHRWTRKRGVPEDVAPLLWVMVQHNVASYQRERNRREQRFNREVDADTMPSSKPDPEQVAEHGEGRERVESILARMPDDAAGLFRMSEIQALPPERIGEILGCRAGALRVRLHRARARFWDLADRLYKVRREDLQ